MKMRKSFLLIIGALLSKSALAACTWDSDPAFGGSQATTLEISGYTIFVDAGAQVDSVISSVNSNAQSRQISFKDCEIGELYGKTALPPLTSTGQVRLFNTSVDGLSVRPAWNNASAFGYFNSSAAMKEKRFNYPVGSFFRLEFVKTAPRLKLTNPLGDIVLNPGIVLRHWVTNDTPTSYGQQLQIGQIRIISIPSCSIDGPKTVDFGQVSADTLTSGVTRNLDFSMTCATDYGSYSATASLIATSPNSDGTIPVLDHAGNTDRMKIQITDSTNGRMPADGTKGESRLRLGDSVAARYNWKATLSRGTGILPEDGNFTARAEILLVVN